MKAMVKILILALVLLTPALGSCIGPIYTGPKTASWGTVDGASGYRVYYRAPGATAWNDSQRIQTSASSVDLVASGVPQGTWELCATSFDTVSESGPSNVVTWSYRISAPPPGLKVE